MKKKAILLINVGTPDKPDEKHVRRFLSPFLNDPLVIDIPWLLRKLLVNLIIIPFRVSKSTKLYQKLWDEKGSPLLYHLESLVQKLQFKLQDEYTVIGAMRYGNPSLKEALRRMKAEQYDELIVMPLFPQYAMSTTGSAIKYVKDEIEHWANKPKLRFVDYFYPHPAFIDVFAKQIQSYHPENFDQLVFSYHGLPLRQIQKMHPSIDSETCNCLQKLPQDCELCYKAACYETTRLLMAKLEPSAIHYTVSFQSRLSKNWLEPFTDKILTNLVEEGKRRILIVAPSFVADCLETIVEIEQDYNYSFIAAGGKELVLVESLNDKDEWVEAIVEIIKDVQN